MLMELAKIIAEVKLQPLVTAGESNVKGCYIGDLLSNVMAKAKEGDIWLTVQTHRNVVAVAHLLNMSGIVVVEGHVPHPETIEKAQEEGIALLATKKSAYEVACVLYSLGLGRAE